uniref:(northern house mosquito) hypothetical protein n=1 Tax=Culex pipiens TaxID=7175 RepID=A0A8D8H0U1_CULPI
MGGLRLSDFESRNLFTSEKKSSVMLRPSTAAKRVTASPRFSSFTSGIPRRMALHDSAERRYLSTSPSRRLTVSLSWTYFPSTTPTDPFSVCCSFSNLFMLSQTSSNL